MDEYLQGKLKRDNEMRYYYVAKLLAFHTVFNGAVSVAILKSF